MAKRQVFEDPHRAGQWSVGKSEHGRRVVLYRMDARSKWETLDIHITAERAKLWAVMLDVSLVARSVRPLRRRAEGGGNG